MFAAGKTFDKYTLVRQLGEGGMGVVWEATNPFGVSVVLKMLHPQLVGEADIVERFNREGRIQYTLKHPNIVRVTDIVEQDGVPALVVDFMRGRDLEAHLLAEGPLEPADIALISGKMLDALALAHSKGFVHRDLKPSNIFLEKAEEGGFKPMLMDFGIAKIQEAAALTRAQEFCGTPAFASPEQIASTKDVDHLSDVYSFGVVMWTMCTGVEPFAERAGDAYAVLAAVVREPLPPLPANVPSWLRAVIDTATHKDKAQRYPDASAFRDAVLNGASSDAAYGDTIVDFATSIGVEISSAPSFADPALDETVSQVDAPPAAARPQSASSPGQRRPAVGPPRAQADLLERGVDTGGFSEPPLEDPKPVDKKRTTRPRAERPIAGAPSGSRADIRLPEAHSRSGEISLRGTGPVDAKRAAEVARSFGDDGPFWTTKRVYAAAAAAAVLAFGFSAWTYVTSRPAQAPAGFSRIEPATFTMGSPATETGRGNDEDAHEVRVTRPFAIQQREVTQRQWTDTMFADPEAFVGCGPDCPVTNVSWVAAARYANRVSVRENLDTCYEIDGNTVTWPEGLDCEGYRLPTEAEWELAARAGTDSAFFNGDLLNPGRSVIDPRLALAGWYGANSDVDYRGASDCRSWGESRENCGPKPVATRRANDWGLYDMHGNVAEWVWDRYDAYGGDARDPIGGESGSQRVIRGGSWKDVAEACRSAARARAPSSERNHIGFRLARTLQ